MLLFGLETRFTRAEKDYRQCTDIIETVSTWDLTTTSTRFSQTRRYVVFLSF